MKTSVSLTGASGRARCARREAHDAAAEPVHAVEVGPPVAGDDAGGPVPRHDGSIIAAAVIAAPRALRPEPAPPAARAPPRAAVASPRARDGAPRRRRAA